MASSDLSVNLLEKVPPQSRDAEMSVLEAGGHFKRTVYASFSRDDEPCEMQSEEFVLK